VVSAIFFILHWPQCVYLVNIPEPVQYKIYVLALPFDLRCESGTCYTYITGTRALPDIYARALGPHTSACGISAMYHIAHAG